MSTDVSESSRAENSGGQQLWNSIAGLLCCCTSRTSRVSGNDIEAKETKSNGEKKEKKKSKENTSGSSDDDRNLLQSEETLFGKQWFGYSRNVPKKGKSFKKNTNLDDLGTESKPIDTNIMKAKLDVRQKKRAPSALHMKRMISHDVFDNNVPKEPTKEADEQPRSEANKTIPEENPVEAKTEENAETVDSSKPPEQNADTSLASKEDGETKDAEEKPADVVAKQENPAAAKEELQEEVAKSTSGETAKENTAVETRDAKKSNETKDVTKDVVEAVASNDVTMTPDDAVKDAAVSPADVKASNDLELQPLVKDTEGISSSAAVITSNAPAVVKDEITDSTLPPTIESPTVSSSPEKNRDGEPVLSNRENCSAPPSGDHLLLPPNEKNATHKEEKEKEEEEEVPKAEASKNKEQASTEETKDERAGNKNADGSKPEAEPSEIKDEHQKQEKTEAEKEISSSESHLPTEAMIKAQET